MRMVVPETVEATETRMKETVHLQTCPKPQVNQSLHRTVTSAIDVLEHQEHVKCMSSDFICYF